MTAATYERYGATVAPPARRLNLRVSGDLHERITALATSERRSLNQQAIILLEKSLRAPAAVSRATR